ncbi:MAG TPA: DedA family protein [Gemmatimonadales bacterium]|nr:DedA family protein [Gemmatimonadales bacterium]
MHHAIIQHWLATYGYLAVFVMVGLESLGVPLPGETTLLAAAATAGEGKLHIWGVIGAAAAGAIAGDAVGYWIGRLGGLPLIRRYGRIIRLDDAKLERARQFYRRHGGKTVFFGRFIALMRVAAAMLAGVTHMPYGRFTLFNATGGICWATVVGLLGYAFGQKLPVLERALGGTSRLVLALAVLAGAAIWVRRRRARRSSEAARRQRESPQPAREAGAELEPVRPRPPGP